MTKPFLWFLPIVVLATLAGPAAAQFYSAPPQPWQQAMPQGFGTTNFTNGPPGVIRFNQPEQYSAPAQPWQRAMPQGFGGTTNCTSGGMGLIRCNQPEQYSAPAQPWRPTEVPSPVANTAATDPEPAQDSALPSPPDPPLQRFDDWEKSHAH